LRELQPQAISNNAVDIRKRKIMDGDEVLAFNDRRGMITSARVTERILPGVADIPQGAWFDPDENGIYRGHQCVDP
jgi:anaerobic dimethyl sulfoxide reductase subunit A